MFKFCWSDGYPSKRQGSEIEVACAETFITTSFPTLFQSTFCQLLNTTLEFGVRERKAGLNLLGALKCFQEIRHTMPLQYVATFLLVALDEGKTIGEYALKADVSLSVMSRHILDLGLRTRGRAPGLGLVVTKQNLINLREHTVHLTDKGRALYRKIVKQLER
jgi:hypothetical protein